MPSRSSVPRRNGDLGVQPDQARPIPRAAARSRRTRWRDNRAGCPAPNSPKLSVKATANLPLRAEGGDRVAHLLHRGEAELVAAEPGVEPLDPRIVAGALERVEEVAHRLLAAEQRRWTTRPGSVPRPGRGRDRRSARCSPAATVCSPRPARPATPRPTTVSTAMMPIAANRPSTKRRMAIRSSGLRISLVGDLSAAGGPARSVQDRPRGCYIEESSRRWRWTTRPAPSSKPRPSARLVAHLRERTDVQNIDLMNLAGFCRNCLSKWYRAAAEEKGVELSDPASARDRLRHALRRMAQAAPEGSDARAEGRLRRVAAEALTGRGSQGGG